MTLVKDVSIDCIDLRKLGVVNVVDDGIDEKTKMVDRFLASIKIMKSSNTKNIVYMRSCLM